MKYPLKKIRSNIPILSKLINNYPLIYLDNASTSQKPISVIKSEYKYYCQNNAAIHRSIYTLSNKNTNKIEKIRYKIAKFIKAKSSKEIVFVKSATEGINLVANSLGKKILKKNDNIVITEMEHHSNIVPWQILAKYFKINIKYIPLLPNGTLNISKLTKIFDKKTKIFSITQLSNVLGTKNPISKIIKKIRKINKCFILIDGTQAIVHNKINVQKMDCDFYVFSGHKMYGPTGIGILYGKYNILKKMDPWQGGGSMINNVCLKNKTTFLNPPWKFEAGTINTAGIIGLGAAIDYINKINISNIKKYEKKLMQYTIKSLKRIKGITLYGHKKKIGIVSFNIKKYHPYDIGTILDQYGIAIRTGHQCAIPIMNYFNVNSMCRVSLAMYNSKKDIDILINKLLKIKKILK